MDEKELAWNETHKEWMPVYVTEGMDENVAEPLRKVTWQDDDGNLVEEEITEEEFSQRFEMAREQFRKRFIEGKDLND